MKQTTKVVILFLLLAITLTGCGINIELPFKTETKTGPMVTESIQVPVPNLNPPLDLNLSFGAGKMTLLPNPGPDLDRFLEIAEAFNQRPSNPTHWRINVYSESDYLAKLLTEKKGDIVVLAGHNDTKMKNIETLNRAGFSILADKPWVITKETLPFLQSAMAADRPLSVDFMTERYEIATLLQKEFLAEEKVFGRIQIENDGNPAVFKECVHHLYKIVNQKPLIRPPWYFDIKTLSGPTSGRYTI